MSALICSRHLIRATRPIWAGKDEGIWRTGGRSVATCSGRTAKAPRPRLFTPYGKDGRDSGGDDAGFESHYHYHHHRAV
jgi:hypothetical protein